MQTPLQVAKTANVTVGTVRNWTRDYAEFLSPSATGSHGPRLFSDADIEMIRAIAALRKSGVPPAEVSARLRNQDVPPIVDATTTAPQSSPQEPTATSQEAPTALETLQPAVYPLQIAYNALQARLEAVERGMVTLEQRQSEKASALVTGIVIGAGVALIVVALVLGMGR